MFNYGNCATGYSLADIAAATGTNRNGNGDGMWGDNGAWWIIILFLFVFCGWGGNGFGGFGNNGAAMGAADNYVLASDFAQLSRQMDSGFDRTATGINQVNNGVCDGFYAMNTGMLNGFANVNANISNGFAGVDNAVCTLGYQTQQGINSVNVAGMQNTNAIQTQLAQCCCDTKGAIKDASYANAMNTNAIQSQLAECCCENRAAIADVKYQMATDTCAINTNACNNTRDIIDNQNANTRSILDFLVQDKISTLQSENAELRLSASQEKQNNYLVNALKPCPVPAYITCNPYQSYGCGCGNNF